MMSSLGSEKPHAAQAADDQTSQSREATDSATDTPQESILDRKRPINSTATSFTSSFSRPSSAGKDKKDTASSTSTASSTHEHASSTSTTSSRRPTGGSGKGGVRDIVSLFERQADKPTASPDQAGTKPSLSISQRKASFGTALSAQKHAHEKSIHTPPVPTRQQSPKPTHNQDIIPTSVPGSEEDDLTFREYQQFFSCAGPKQNNSSIQKKKSYGAIGTMSSQQDKKPGQDSPEPNRRVGQGFAVKDQAVIIKDNGQDKAITAQKSDSTQSPETKSFVVSPAHAAVPDTVPEPVPAPITAKDKTVPEPATGPEHKAVAKPIFGPRNFSRPQVHANATEIPASAPATSETAVPKPTSAEPATPKPANSEPTASESVLAQPAAPKSPGSQAAAAEPSATIPDESSLHRIHYDSDTSSVYSSGVESEAEITVIDCRKTTSLPTAAEHKQPVVENTKDGSPDKSTPYPQDITPQPRSREEAEAF